MMSSRSRSLPALLLLLLGVLPLRAYGDPVRITSGFLEVPGVGRSATFHFAGNDFEASGLLEPGDVGPDRTCNPCAARDRIELTTFFSGNMGSGTATVDGTASAVDFAGSLLFSAPSFLAPSTAGDFTQTDTFTFSSNLLGILNLNMPDETIAFERTLTGRGVVSAAFQSTPTQPGDPPLFSFKDVRFDFSSADAVPEPATLLLFGTGLAAAFGYRKRRTG
jgi:PEP-CTERM motif-containing protein